MHQRDPRFPARGMSRAAFLRASAGLAGASLMGIPLAGLAAEPPVLRRPIPSSGQLLPVVGTGTAVVYDIDPTDSRFPTLVETVRTLIANGGALIDTSPTYGQAERNLGEILRRLERPVREQAFIATKISTIGEQSGIDSVAKSFADMGVEKVDLLQVHNVRDTNTHLRTIRRLQEQGKVRYVGITTSFVKTHEEYLRIMKTEKLDFIQIDYALDNRLAEERILPLAQERGMAVIINLPFGRNRLFKKAKGRELPDFAREFDCTSWAQFFLKFLIGHPAVTVVMPGTDRPEFAIDNLKAGRGRLPDAKMRQRMVEYWDSLA
jgi:aryl-alcohol dehydrogenase-like predicted oxidoreductase